MARMNHEDLPLNKAAHNTRFEGKKQLRLGTAKAPAMLSVQSQERKVELLTVFEENNWACEISVNADEAENLADLETLQSRIQAISTKQASRNDPCPCGSGKKYKKCCVA